MWWIWLALLPAAAPAMSLQQAVREGLSIHPLVRAAQADAARAGTEVKIAKGGYFPALQVSAGPQTDGLNDVVYDVTLSQMLYDWGRVSSRVQGASATQRRFDDAARVASDDAALDIVETYLDVLASQRRVEAVHAHMQRLQEISAMTDARSSSGYADRSEQDRARLEMARAQEQLALEEGELTDARNQFRLLVGAEPDALAEPDPVPLQRHLQGSDIDRVIAQAPLLQAAQEDVQVAESELRESRAALLPQLNLEASALRREIGGRLEDDQTISLRLRMDVMQGISNFRRPEAARQKVESAHWTADATRRDVRRQLRTLFDNAQALQWREQALQQQVDDSDDVGALYREQFEVGRRDVIDLLNVQRERMEAERQLATLHLERKRIEYRAAAQVGLLQAMLEGSADGR